MSETEREGETENTERENKREIEGVFSHLKIHIILFLDRLKCGE